MGTQSENQLDLYARTIAMAPAAIVIKITGHDAIEGLDFKVLNTQAENQERNFGEAEKLGVNALQYGRPVGDTGDKPIDNARNVVMGSLLETLTEHGYVYVAGVIGNEEGKAKPVNKLTFVRDAEDGVEMPEAVRKFLEETTFASLNVFINPKVRTVDGQDVTVDGTLDTYRMDTINLSGFSKKYPQLMKFDGKIYSLEEVAKKEKVA